MLKPWIFEAEFSEKKGRTWGRCGPLEIGCSALLPGELVDHGVVVSFAGLEDARGGEVDLRFEI